MLLVGDWTVHERFDRLTRAEEEIHITPRAMDVLVHLAKNPGRPVSKEELLETFWRGSISSDNAVHKTMAELRRVFGDNSRNPLYIETYPKRGYQLIADVSIDDAVQTPAQNKDKPVTIAVLPFLNLIIEQAHQHFGDGLSEDIANYLGRSQYLGAISHTASFQFREVKLDPREIGRRLKATHLIEGSVRSQENLIRTTAQLIEVISGKQVWAVRYDRDVTDSLAIQDELATTIVIAVHDHFDLKYPAATQASMDQSYLTELF